MIFKNKEFKEKSFLFPLRINRDKKLFDVFKVTVSWFGKVFLNFFNFKVKLINRFKPGLNISLLRLNFIIDKISGFLKCSEQKLRWWGERGGEERGGKEQSGMRSY